MGKVSSVLIAGAGPSGLTLALLLAKQGIKTTVVDMAPHLNSAPRATHYSWPAVYELGRAGVLEEVIREGFINDRPVSWRKLDGTLLAQVDIESIPRDKRMVCLPLNHLTSILEEHLSKEPSATILWNHKVLGVGQDTSQAWADVETPTGIQVLKADYVVGCDGANSQIRRSLFGDGDFPGKTWDEQIVATNAYYDMTKSGWKDDSAFIVDPEHWGMIAKIRPDGLLRISYGEVPGLSNEEYIARQPMKFKAILPGNPDPDSFRVVSISPYKVHQRLARSLRVGKILLAADAAHLCNPFGGLGLTGGLVDVGNLYDCFLGIHQELVDDTILDRYSEVRRQKYLDIIDPVSSENLRRLTQDAEAADKDALFQKLRDAKSDPSLSMKLNEGLWSIMHDFRKEYNAPATGSTTVGRTG
ncbi:putative monooxygenase [Dactylonectria estremocensis]|uniref:Monooxygenase n=1 Tax=Dactylonectria estremocensis TaxID=1079267 RepID=A0A9P9EH65_9HYPO|nr:putative monooxygenase [Dactylonectria estremocensis]